MKEVLLQRENGQTDPAPAAPETGERKDARWWAEVKGVFWLVLIVLGFHSFVAKPFYIPSESMLPTLRVGDRLVVTKFAYGWSYVSPTIPNPVAIFKSLVLREPEDSWSVAVPFVHGRLLGHMPERGDVAIVTPPGANTDYIKRVIGLPGDRLEVRDGAVILNGRPLKRVAVGDTVIPVDANSPCNDADYPGARQAAPNGGFVCRLPTFRETLPGGRSYDTIDLGWSPGDNYGPITVPANHVFMMGDNRDRSADSRFPADQLGLGGPVPWEKLGGRAEFVTFSLNGSATLNPLTWAESFRWSRAGVSLHPAHDQAAAK
jgi:signal peptidase I